MVGVVQSWPSRMSIKSTIGLATVCGEGISYKRWTSCINLHHPPVVCR